MCDDGNCKDDPNKYSAAQWALAAQFWTDMLDLFKRDPEFFMEPYLLAPEKPEPPTEYVVLDMHWDASQTAKGAKS
jgi:hypothetical protein